MRKGITSTILVAVAAAFIVAGCSGQPLSTREKGTLLGGGLGAATGAIIGAAVGAPGAVPGSDDEAKARLGDYFAEVLLLDQGTAAAKARAELGWAPSHPGLPEEFRDGSYRKVTTG